MTIPPSRHGFDLRSISACIQSTICYRKPFLAFEHLPYHLIQNFYICMTPKSNIPILSYLHVVYIHRIAIKSILMYISRESLLNAFLSRPGTTSTFDTYLIGIFSNPHDSKELSLPDIAYLPFPYPP